MRLVIILFTTLLGLTFFSGPLHAQELTKDIMKNRYHLQLPRGDKATVYLHEDQSLTLMPYFANQDYVHVCWGRWDLEERDKILKIMYAKDCKIINGTYKVIRKGDNLVLKSRSKTLVFQSLPTR